MAVPSPESNLKEPNQQTEPAKPSAAAWWLVPVAYVREKLQEREDHVFLALSLIIGVVTGLVVVALILVSERLGSHLYPPGAAAWRRVLIPIVGTLGIGYLLYRYFPFARGSGIPQTKAALFAREGKILFRTVIGKFVCTAGTLASGIPLGREGPSVQVGAGLASVLGRNLGLRPEKVKALIPVGGAAAIAAAFNTPLAAVVFSLEEIVGDLHAPVLGSVVLASATSWGVLRLLLGNNPLFKAPQYQLVNPSEFAIYAVLGLAGGVLSAAFTKLLLHLRAGFLRLPERTLWFQPVAGGLLVGLLGWFVPQVLGVGYRYVGDALNGTMMLKLILLLLLLKFITVIVSYASGNAGGIFGPALFMGAMLGGAVGTFAHRWFPAHTATAGAYALVGMGTVFAGIIRAPMTSVLMIFEMTQDYAVIVPLMVSNLVGYFISTRLQEQSLYEGLARQDGIHLPSSEARQRHFERRVERIMRRPTEYLASSLTVREAAVRIGASKQTWLVMEGGFVAGVVRSSLLEVALLESGERRLAEILHFQDFPHVHPDQGFDLALERMGINQIDILPVVNRADIRKLEGIVTLREVLEAYGVRNTEA